MCRDCPGRHPAEGETEERTGVQEEGWRLSLNSGPVSPQQLHHHFWGPRFPAWAPPTFWAASFFVVGAALCVIGGDNPVVTTRHVSGHGQMCPGVQNLPRTTALRRSRDDLKMPRTQPQHRSCLWSERLKLSPGHLAGVAWIRFFYRTLLFVLLCPPHPVLSGRRHGAPPTPRAG